MTDDPIRRAETAIDDAMSTARTIKDEAGNIIDRYQRDVVESAREKPLTTLGVAIVLGFLIGAVWKS